MINLTGKPSKETQLRNTNTTNAHVINASYAASVVFLNLTC